MSRILIVGGTSGIGRGLAVHYASANPPANVTIMGRNAAAASELAKSYPNINFMSVDATLMAEVMRSATEFKRTNNKLDALILCQGVLNLDKKDTSEGIDDKFALAYYGRMLFIRELLPIMHEGSRVMTVLNAQQGNASKVHWDDLGLKTSYGLSASINHLFVFNDIMMQYFSERHPGIHFTHAFPGWVDTSIGQGLPWYIRMLMYPLSKIRSISPAACAVFMSRAMEETQGWRLADNKGNTITKPPVSSEKIEAIAQFTWQVVDGALQKS